MNTPRIIPLCTAAGILALVACADSTPTTGPVTPRAALATQFAPNDTVFRDGFEQGNGWALYEEVVNPDYGTGLGSVSVAPGHAMAGQYGLVVWSDSAMSSKSNHVSAIRRIGY